MAPTLYLCRGGAMEARESSRGCAWHPDCRLQSECNENTAVWELTMHLSNHEILTILDFIEARRHVRLYFERFSIEAQGLILGGDIENNLLCVSETFPDSGMLLAQSSKGEEAYLRIKLGTQYLVLTLLLAEHAAGLSYWKIVARRWTSNKRWQARLRFDAYHSPKVTLVREFEENLSAKLHDISDSGFSVSIWNKDVQQSFLPGQRCLPRIEFNEDFTFY